MLLKYRTLLPALLGALGLVSAASVEAINFGDMMNPGKWMGGNKDRHEGPPPGYGYQPPYGPQGGYYGGQPGPGYGGGYPGGDRPGGGYPAMGQGPYQQGYGVAPGYAAPGAGPGGVSGIPPEERIRQLEQRIQQLEQQLHRR